MAGLRWRSFTRRPRRGEPRLAAGLGRARLLRVNQLFLLGPDDLPQASLFSWKGYLPLPADGPPAELLFRPSNPSTRADPP